MFLTKFIHKSKNKKHLKNIRNKAICLSSTLVFLGNQFIIPIAHAESTNNNADLSNIFSNNIDNSDISLLKGYIKDNKLEDVLSSNLLSKNFNLNAYELLILSELIKSEIINNTQNENERNSILKDLLDLQNKYKNDYKLIFNKEPETVSDIDNNIKEDKDFYNTPIINDDNSSGYNPVPNHPNRIPINGYSGKNDQENNSNNNPSLENQYKDNIKHSSTPQELVDNMSLININSTNPHTTDREKPDTEGVSPLNDFSNNPEYDYNKMSSPVNNLENKANAGDINEDKELLSDIINTEIDNSTKKAKNYFITLSHDIYYVDEGGEGNVPLDTSVTNDNGEYYQKTVTSQYQLEDALEIGLGFRVHKSLDLIVGMVASNDDGSIFNKGTKWEFGNVLFKFHPERLSPIEMKKLDTEGIVVKNNGKYVGKRLGHEVTVGTDTTSGNFSAQLGNNPNNAILYDRESGLELGSKDTKYFIGYGKLSLDLSSYTLQLSDCKAVEVGYNDKNESLILLYGKPDNSSDSTETTSKYQNVSNRSLFAAQYTSHKMFPNMDIAFNYASGKSEGQLTNSTDINHTKTTVYSIVVKSKNMKGTSFQGEFAHSNNDYNIDDNSNSTNSSGNADYFDIAHTFSNRLSGTLHLINIDGTYDASSLVEDKTGDYLLTTNTGDGLPDYLYKSGQKGLDLILNYNFPENASLAFGYTRYSKTTEQDSTTGEYNSKTGIFLSGNKRWNLTDSNGVDKGTINFQQRFEYRDVSNKDYINHTSDSTLSYQGSPWENGEVAMDAQHISDNADGNENRFDLSVAHNFYPLERVTITPKIEYQRKIGTDGIEEQNAMNSTVLINSLTIGYELIPDELTVNLLISKEKYDIISSEIDESTGKKVDGEKRDVLGTGIGLVWEPSHIKNLTLGLSYRKDKVHYYTPTDENSNQDVWEFTAKYDKPISNNVRASISYDYKSAKDRVKPIYDDITRTVSININASINDTTSIKLEHSYESEYKPLDPSANHAVHTTVLRMTNKF